MNITIEQNKVVVNLEPDEFKVFEKMFANLQTMKTIKVEFRDFPGGNLKYGRDILPMHLCRTIGGRQHRQALFFGIINAFRV